MAGLSRAARRTLERLAAEGPLPTARVPGPGTVSGISAAALVRRGLAEEVALPHPGGGARWRVRITAAGRAALEGSDPPG